MPEVTKEIYDKFLDLLDKDKINTYKTRLEEIAQCGIHCSGCPGTPFGAKLDKDIHPIDLAIIDSFPRKLLDHDIDLTVTKKRDGSYIAVAVYDRNKKKHYLNHFVVKKVFPDIDN